MGKVEPRFWGVGGGLRVWQQAGVWGGLRLSFMRKTDR